ncbi:MAG: OmpH family outer membrane protein [Sutterellaceae bacterium]|nr:OmpH family outer membrane protein [Sutterellaceae bacterium]
MFKKALIAAAGAALLCGAANADDFKVGVVSPARLLSESAPAVAAQDKLKNYFKKREEELNRDIRDFRTRAQKFEKDSPVMTETERLKQRNGLAETERDIARRQRALVEERNQRASEESQLILQRANRIIQDIAKKQKFDLILQDAIWASPRADITEQVMKELNKPAK